MRALPGNAINWVAGAVILGGVAWAGSLYFGPHQSGPDVAGLQALADRLAGQHGPMLGDRAPGARRSAAEEAAMIAMPRVDYAALRRAKRRLAAQSEPAPAVQPVHDAAPPPPAPTPEPAAAEEGAEDALKDLALVGVTTTDGKDSALLVHIESQERQNVSVGETVLGFKVKAIQPDAVVLAKGAQDVTIRLGDHDMAQQASARAADDGGDEDADGSPFGRRRDRGDDRDRARFADAFGRGFGDRSSFSGDFRSRGDGDFRSRGGDGDFRSSVSQTSGGRDDRGSRGNGSFGSSGFSTPVFGGGFPVFGGFGSSNRQRGSSSNSFASGATGSTSNPQTARRRGSPTAGDAGSEPDPISNPQTERRRGTSSQPAFGETDNTARSRGTDSGRGR